MGALSFCSKLVAALVALLAAAVGALRSGLLQSAGLFKYFDQRVGSRGAAAYKGLLPVFHEGMPWGFTLEEMPDLTGETFLVTGANVGLGYWTAYHLAARRGEVTLGCRNEAKCAKAAQEIGRATGASVETLQLDLSSFRSIRAAAKKFAAQHSSLDSLVLNAGVMMSPFSLTEDGLESQMGTNHVGHFLLTQLLMPVLEVAATQRGLATVVSVSSNAHYSSYPEGILPSIERMNNALTYNRVKAYGQSKLANVLFAQELAKRVEGKGILVNSLHPGGVDTELARHVFDLIKSYSTGLGEWLEKDLLSSVAWHPKDAALTQLYCAVGPKVREGKITGKYFHPIARENRPDIHAFNTTLQKQLWSLTEKFIAAH